MYVNSVCTVIISETVLNLPYLSFSPSYLSLQMSHSVFVVFLAQAAAFAVSGGFCFFKDINLAHYSGTTQM